MPDERATQEILDDAYDGERFANSLRQGKRREQVAFSERWAWLLVWAVILATVAVVMPWKLEWFQR